MFFSVGIKSSFGKCRSALRYRQFWYQCWNWGNLLKSFFFVFLPFVKMIISRWISMFLTRKTGETIQSSRMKISDQNLGENNFSVCASYANRMRRSENTFLWIVFFFQTENIQLSEQVLAATRYDTQQYFNGLEESRNVFIASPVFHSKNLFYDSNDGSCTKLLLQSEKAVPIQK